MITEQTLETLVFPFSTIKIKHQEHHFTLCSLSDVRHRGTNVLFLCVAVHNVCQNERTKMIL